MERAPGARAAGPHPREPRLAARMRVSALSHGTMMMAFPGCLLNVVAAQTWLLRADAFNLNAFRP